MEYIFEYTEQNAQKASEFETKALLYLIGIDKDKNNISLVFIDCFNDITGTDKNSLRLWDIQSKGVSNMSPAKIGRSLITLFLNYSSGLNFQKFALLIPQPKDSYLTLNNQIEFGIENLSKVEEKIKSGLTNELKERKSITNLTDKQEKEIDHFLETVRFIVDIKSNSDYIKSIVKFKGKELKTEPFYESIFKEIKERQSIKNSHQFTSKKYLQSQKP